MAVRKRSFEKYLKKASEGTQSQVQEAYGFLKDIKDPGEQELDDITELKLSDGQTVEVPTGWMATIVTDDGEEVTWRWPAHIKDGQNELGINIISKGYTLGDVMDPEKVWHFYRDDSRRAHVELVEDE